MYLGDIIDFLLRDLLHRRVFLPQLPQFRKQTGVRVLDLPPGGDHLVQLVDGAVGHFRLVINIKYLYLRKS